jgi:hypothetical protein
LSPRVRYNSPKSARDQQNLYSTLAGESFYPTRTERFLSDRWPRTVKLRAEDISPRSTVQVIVTLNKKGLKGVISGIIVLASVKVTVQ